MEVEIKNGKLIITLPTQKPAPSKSGKSMIVATTNGFASTTAEVGGKPVRISVNAIV